MHLQNLGQIKDANITLNNMNVFLGENGTGKTITAYAIFAFQDWFTKNYKVNYINSEILKLLKDTEHHSISVHMKSIIDSISSDVVSKFNSLDSSYFIGFYKDEQIYSEKKSKIMIDKLDVQTLLREPSNRNGWYQEWPIVSNDSSVNNLTDQGLKNILLISGNSEDIEISYRLINSINRDTGLDMVNNPNIDKNTQIDQLITNENLIEIANSSLKSVLFSNKYVYLPAERIGYDVFRRSVKSYRLNYISNNSSAGTLDGNQTQNSLISYPTPIERYMQSINDSLDQKGHIIPDPFISMLKPRLFNGEFHYETETDKVSYRVHDNTDDSDNNITFDMLSSSLKSLFGFSTTLNDVHAGDWLYIDEPEMNLHPVKQKKMAFVLYNLLKRDVHLVISTHSDYLIKSLMNLMLQDRIDEQNSYKKVSAFQFERGNILKLGNIATDEFDASNFDKTTDEINDEFSELVEILDERANTQGDL